MEIKGASVFAPTIPTSCKTLESSIRYIIELIKAQDLYNCILVGHSFGGMVISGVADRIKPRIKKAIFLDAAVPSNGDDFASHIVGISDQDAEQRRQTFKALSKDGVWITPLSAQLAGITNTNDIEYVNTHSRPFRLSDWLEPIIFETGGLTAIAKTYILSIAPPTNVMGYPTHGAVAKQSEDWVYREIDCGHAAMLIKPKEVAKLLME